MDISNLVPATEDMYWDEHDDSGLSANFDTETKTICENNAANCAVLKALLNAPHDLFKQEIIEKLFCRGSNMEQILAYKMGVARGQLIAAEALANGAEKGENL